KRTAQVRARADCPSFIGAASASGELSAYEIHMGRTIAADGGASPFRVIRRNGEPCDPPDGPFSGSRASVGSMLHGRFEHADLRAAMLSSLRKRKGLPEGQASQVASREAEYQRLSGAVRASLNIPAVKRIARIV